VVECLPRSTKPSTPALKTRRQQQQQHTQHTHTEVNLCLTVYVGGDQCMYGGGLKEKVRKQFS
jgi:hypothetical protein